MAGSENEFGLGDDNLLACLCLFLHVWAMKPVCPKPSKIVKHPVGLALA